MGYADQKAIGQSISSSDINSLMKTKTIKEQILSKSYTKNQLKKVLDAYDDTDEYDLIRIKANCTDAQTNWLVINKEQYEKIISVFD